MRKNRVYNKWYVYIYIVYILISQKNEHDVSCESSPLKSIGNDWHDMFLPYVLWKKMIKISLI